MYQITNHIAIVRSVIIIAFNFACLTIPSFYLILSLSPSQLTAMLDHGELGQLALPPADGETKIGRGKDNFKISTLDSFIFIFIQDEHCRCNAQRGKVRKAEDN